MKDAARLLYTLTPMTQKEAEWFGISEEERRSLIRMDSGKVNIAPPSSTATWFRLVGVPLGNATSEYPNGDEVQTVEPWTPPSVWGGLDTPLLNRILDDIAAGRSDGSRYSASPSATTKAAWRVVVKHVSTVTEEQARGVIRTWLKTGLLYEEKYDDQVDRKGRLGLWVNDAKRPS